MPVDYTKQATLAQELAHIGADKCDICLGRGVVTFCNYPNDSYATKASLTKCPRCQGTGQPQPKHQEGS